MSLRVFWDFDGTLAFREGLWGGCLLELLDEELADHGLVRGQIDLSSGFPWHTYDVAHPELADPERWWEMMTSLLSTAMVRAGVDAAPARRVAGSFRDAFLEPGAWHTFGDTTAALQEAKGRGWVNVILSNHVPELDRIVYGLGLSDLVEGVVTSAATGFEKPHPDAYRAAFEIAGSVSTGWMVGDNPLADVAGAERAGLSAILVRYEDVREAVTLVEDARRVLTLGRREQRELGAPLVAAGLMDAVQVIARGNP